MKFKGNEPISEHANPQQDETGERFSERTIPDEGSTIEADMRDKGQMVSADQVARRRGTATTSRRRGKVRRSGETLSAPGGPGGKG